MSKCLGRKREGEGEGERGYPPREGEGKRGGGSQSAPSFRKAETGFMEEMVRNLKGRGRVEWQERKRSESGKGDAGNFK